jgi:hypothetical protein
MSGAASGVEGARADAIGAAGASEDVVVLAFGEIGAWFCDESADAGGGVLGE